MSNDEYPINLMYEGIADLLREKGKTVTIANDGTWDSETIEYGGYLYAITKHDNEIINISRIKEE